jgi:putative ABC transport system permease protein
VGATQRQIAQTILYEGIWLSIIGIPAGIAVGLAVQFIGVRIANVLLVDINAAEATPIVFQFVLAWQAIAAAMLVGLATVLVSAFVPALKASRIPAIDAIRKESGAKVKNTRFNKSGRLAFRLFGFEGALAVKSLKRSKRNFRATVISLTISIVLFIGASSFGTHLNRMARLVLHTVDADVIGEYIGMLQAVDDDLTYQSITHGVAEEVTARLREFPGTTVIGAGSNVSTTRVTATTPPPGMVTPALRNRFDPEGLHDLPSIPFALVAVDAETYADIINRAGVPHGSNILINYMRWRDVDRWVEFIPFYFDYQTIFTSVGNDIVEIPLHGELRGDQIPTEILDIGRHMPIAIVPELDAKAYKWYAQTNDPAGFAQFMRGLLYEYLPINNQDPFAYINVRNLSAEGNTDRAIVRLVMVFIYGFVGMLTLIGLTNVISTIATNIRSRSREFAVLQSVGMTHKGLNRMLNLESILCSIKSLVYGIPLGIAASYLIYTGVLRAVYFGYAFPFIPILQCVAAVFVITWVTKRYAAARLRGGSVVESIREN